MLIKFLKRGLFSIDPVHGPVVKCAIGSEDDLPDKHALTLLEYGWAEAVSEAIDVSEEQTPEPVETVAIESDYDATPALSTIGAPWDMSDWDTKAKDAKAILEQYGKDHFGIDIDRRKSVKNIIKQLKQAAV